MDLTDLKDFVLTEFKTLQTQHSSLSLREYSMKGDFD